MSTHVSTRPHHARRAQGTGNAKQGFSLYALLNRAHSPPGRRLIKQWMLRPSIALPGLHARHNGVEFFLTHRECAAQLDSALRDFRDVGRVLVRMRRLLAKVSDWVALRSTVIAAAKLRMIVGTFREHAAAAIHSFGALNALLDPKHEQLGIVHSLLSNVDFEVRLPTR